MLKSTIFRECDIRGIAGRDLPSDDVVHLGRAIGTNLRRRSGPSVIVGQDCRLSSDRLHRALCEGLLAAGCDVTSIGTVPTPVLYYSAIRGNADGAVMITGSHNPGDYNGFKIVSGSGTLHGEEIQEIYRIMERQDYESGAGTLRTQDFVPDYVNELAGQFQLPRRVKVVVDSGNGTAGPVIGPLLKRLNCDYVSLFDQMDGGFPNHHPDPSSPSNLRTLAAVVRYSGAELGIGFDGDGDRIGVVDENGNPVFGDMLLLLFAREILRRKPGATIIGEVKCSQLLYDEIERLGGRALMGKAGHALIKAEMQREGAELAGEMSGHMFFSDRYFGYDDALYAACRLLEIVSTAKRPLSREFDGLPKIVTTPEFRLASTDESKFAVVARVADHFRQTRRIVEIDGARVIFPRGWGLIRASNTQPVLVTRFEAETQELLDAYRHEVESVLVRETGAPLQAMR